MSSRNVRDNNCSFLEKPSGIETVVGTIILRSRLFEKSRYGFNYDFCSAQMDIDRGKSGMKTRYK